MDDCDTKMHLFVARQTVDFARRFRQTLTIFTQSNQGAFMSRTNRTYSLFLLLLVLPLSSRGDDWPAWRHDASRSAVSPGALSDSLQLQWTVKGADPRPAWPETQHKLQFDIAYSPVVKDKTIYVPSNVNDRVTAYDTETGEERWRFYADGPVRFAPVAWRDKLLFVSDDGYLYCLDAESGKLAWRFRGGPNDRQLLGNERLTSTWPARGAPVVVDDTLYFGAGIWPFMGVFLHAIDLKKGAEGVVWTNSGSGSVFILQQHASPAFAGVAPQGYFAATDDYLLVSGGRTVPAIYDRKTGELLHYELASRAFGKDAGGFAVGVVGEDRFINYRMVGQSKPGGAVYNLTDASPGVATDASIIDDELLIGVDDGKLVWSEIATRMVESKSARGKAVTTKKTVLDETLSAKLPDGVSRAFVKAGKRVYCGGAGVVVAVEEGNEPSITWRASFDGDPCEMIAADDRLFVATREGDLHCFGDATGEPRVHALDLKKPSPSSEATARARMILEGANVRDGFALVMGTVDGGLAEAIAIQSNLNVIALAADAYSVSALRRQFDDAGWPAGRLSVQLGGADSPSLPPYFVSLIAFETTSFIPDYAGEEFLARIYRSVRPYGGVIVADGPQKARDDAADVVREAKPEGGVLEETADLAILRRAGALTDSANWTHQYGDATNSVVSRDARVGAPLGLLWYGGPSHEAILPRHGHGPTPHVIDGRLIIEGPDMLRATDVYTGRLLWETSIPGVGLYYDITDHQAGANETGGNYVSSSDGVYVIEGDEILRLDLDTGKRVASFMLPAKDGDQPNWGRLALCDDLLIAAASPVHLKLPKAPKKAKGAKAKAAKSAPPAKPPQARITENARFGQSSERLLAIDRHTGEVKWEEESVHGFRHNAIAVGAGKVLAVDGVTPAWTSALKRRGEAKDEPFALLALDAETGEQLWRVDEKVHGSWVSFSEEFDVVFVAGSKGPDRAKDEIGAGMAVYRASDGDLLWRSSEAYEGPCMIHHRTIITQSGGPNTSAAPAKAFDLLTGEKKTREHPMTGEDIPWSWLRYKGCNTAIASERLLTFRSAAACYLDLETGQGTTSLGGFKSGCTSNLIVANGLLNAPDYTRTCECSYQNQCSLALVPVADDPSLRNVVEAWSFDYYPTPKETTSAKRFGLNIGAPGNRFGDDGTLWLEAPSVGGPSPEVSVEIEPADVRLITRHSSRVVDEPLSWVASSGAVGIRKLTIRPFLEGGSDGATIKGFEKHAPVAKEKEAPEAEANDDTPTPSNDPARPYTVRLVFAELEGAAPGKRAFNVSLQGETVLKRFDIAETAGGEDGIVVKEFTGVMVSDAIKIELKGSRRAKPILCGVQVVAEGW